MAHRRVGTERVEAFGPDARGGTHMPAKDEMPSTIQRSPKKAQRTWSKAHDSAVDEYGEGERAHRTAFAALKHSYEKVGDHWEGKDEKGPSDPQAAKSGRDAGRGGGRGGGGGASRPREETRR